MIVYNYDHHARRITDDDGRSVDISVAREAFERGDVDDCNLAFHRLAQNEWDCDAVASYYAEVKANKSRVADRPIMPTDKDIVMGTRNDPDQMPAAVRIEDGEEPIAWRAYPCSETTLEEMYRACVRFGLRVYVDLQGDVCLICNRDVPEKLPTASDLFDCLYAVS